MASAKKCDRCGTLYERYASTINKKYNFNGLALRKYTHDSPNPNEYWVGKVFELCPECSRELESWLSNEK